MFNFGLWWDFTICGLNFHNLRPLFNYQDFASLKCESNQNNLHCLLCQFGWVLLFVFIIWYCKMMIKNKSEQVNMSLSLSFLHLLLNPFLAKIPFYNPCLKNGNIDQKWVTPHLIALTEESNFHQWQTNRAAIATSKVSKFVEWIYAKNGVCIRLKNTNKLTKHVTLELCV